MANTELLPAIEAILFSLSEGIEKKKLAEILEIEKKDLNELLDLYKEKLSVPESGIELVCFDDLVQITTKSDYYSYLIKATNNARKQKLTDTVLETLSIIAYKQPITRAEIERIRGVACDHQIDKLLEYDLICELGRLNVPGRPLLFGTTKNFLRTFNVTELSELPELNPVQLEEFKRQAEEEIQLELNL